MKEFKYGIVTFPSLENMLLFINDTIEHKSCRILGNIWEDDLMVLTYRCNVKYEEELSDYLCFHQGDELYQTHGKNLNDFLEGVLFHAIMVGSYECFLGIKSLFKNMKLKSAAI